MSVTAHAEDALVLRQDEAGVATRGLNRPKRYNTAQAMLGALLQTALDTVGVDPPSGS